MYKETMVLRGATGMSPSLDKYTQTHLYVQYMSVEMAIACYMVYHCKQTMVNMSWKPVKCVWGILYIHMRCSPPFGGWDLNYIFVHAFENIQFNCRFWFSIKGCPSCTRPCTWTSEIALTRFHYCRDAHGLSVREIIGFVSSCVSLVHDDVIKWKHFPCYCHFFVGNSPVTREFPSLRSMTRNFDVFFDLRLNTRLSK